ncbi:toxin-antitoxin system, toxin component family protein [Streptomyces sp. FXJ1.172]|uniref:toxin-antitoxin system, toxin component family protein n=1 Tax=Streptomyces sp. FXJ1.172 TaxID=710705 RepID=UPI000ACABCD5|nr:toxin-antitoxin system, toxin component family protein [Streptomyces sp. FXJ1.172]WEO97620.1 toxin-antitoxin system, toxin component family protein [Streptomyces sp. FXJ1.172]
MGIAGASERLARLAPLTARLLPSRPGSTMRSLARDLATAVRARPDAPHGVRELCRALCEEMSALRGGRPLELRFERFPDELEVTGLWVEFADFDLVIVEERAESVQQLVILGHELWHLHAGHRHHDLAKDALAGDALAGDAAARALAGAPGWREAALTVAARNGSREADEAEADDFGHRLATLFRGRLAGARAAPADPVQRALGYRGRERETNRASGKRGGGSTR